MAYYVHRDLRSTGQRKFVIRDESYKELDRAEYVYMVDVEFYVNQSRSRRVTETGRTSTHAYAYGNVVDSDNTTTPDLTGRIRITYNPYEHTSFIRTDTGDEVSYTASLVCYQGKVYADKETLI